MSHPILSVVSKREFQELSRRVQYGEISWPQCFERGAPIRLDQTRSSTNTTPAVRTEGS